MTAEEEHKLLVHFLRGNEFAIDFCESLARISQVWDDLVDCDTIVSSKQINEAFWRALLEIPNNPFYRKHIDTLLPVMQTVVIDWLDANELEKQDDHGRNLAFVLRDRLGSLVILCAHLVGGYAWGREISTQVRRTLANNETLEDYKTFLASGTPEE